MFAARKTDGATAAGPATYIEDVFSTYLYTGNGSIQTIPNGIALGSAYGGSVYFDGTSDYLRTASTTAAAFGTGDFTMEVWANPTTTPSVYRGILSTYDGSTGAIIQIINGEFAFWVGTHTLSGVTATLGSWAHLALTRSGTTVRFFVNGVLRNTELAHTTNYSSSPITVGAIDTSGAYDFNGYTSNARIIKGTALYTSTFTPPTVPLTAVSGTSFLTCQSPNPITDYSSNALSITVNGNAVAQNGGGPFTDSTANKGGMVWLKGRSGAAAHALYDTARGATFDLASNSTAAQTTETTGLTSFNSNGFSIGTLAKLNTNAATYTSWTFRKQAKFFDVVTYTGNGSTTRTISHNLGSVPGFIIIKETSAAEDWCVLAGDSSGNYQYLYFNTGASSGSVAKSSVATSTTIDIAPIRANYGTNAVNESSQNYVMYLFAHDAGGFGATGTDNVISCGSFTADGSGNATVSLGYEPQWVMIKASSTTAPWNMFDVMRGMAVGGSGSNNDNILQANSAGAETASYGCDPSSTGFIANGWSASQTYIYIAIRRGPMKTPTSGTSVFAMDTQTSFVANEIVDSSFPPDALFAHTRTSTGSSWNSSRITGGYLDTSSTAAETAGLWFYNGPAGQIYATSQYTNTPIYWLFRRAPGFFDVVCYTGTGANRTVTHNLGVAPELMIVKKRQVSSVGWFVYSAALGATERVILNLTDAKVTTSLPWNNTAPTSTVFSLGTATEVNGNADTFVAYLFASVTGVSKVGSYTGTGTTKQIDCGFTAGARFVMIKRTDSTGDWYVWDTARGIVSGNDPYLLLNSTAAEVTSTDYIDPLNAGFEISSTAPAAINANGGNFIYLAIA